MEGAMSRRSLAVAFSLVSVVASAIQADNWSASDARITKAEFLQLYFEMKLHHPETEQAANSFNLVSFYPSAAPAHAIVFIVQTYNDEDQPIDNPRNRQAIREVAGALVQHFEALFGLPIVSRRWPLTTPRHALIIKHVRIHDLQDVLAVTVDGITSFDTEDFKNAEKRVRNAGGVWAW
jgi:hypothetical protein